MPKNSGELVRHVLAAAATVLLATGCQPTVSTHGHTIDPTQLAQIQPGITSREEVARLLGSPSTRGTFEKESWFYISQRNEAKSFYQAKVTEQDVVRIDFSADGIVAGVNEHGLELAQAVQPDPNKTRTMGNELTLLQQFVGNIGRFNSGPEGGPSRGAPGG
jgi:outer membrane protein assembly factor BamE (lipoprotein component of BamABCDE complex)